MSFVLYSLFARSTNTIASEWLRAGRILRGRRSGISANWSLSFMRVGFVIRYSRPGNPDVLTSKERPALNLPVCCCLALVPSLVCVSCTHRLPIELV